MDFLPRAIAPVAITPELAAAALASDAMSAALRLTSWVGSRKRVTARGVLSPGLALEACAALGIELPPGKTKLRSMVDVPVLARDWGIAVSAGLVLVGAYGRALRALDEDEDAAVLIAWLRAIAAPLWAQDDQCAQWLAAVAVLASADGDSVAAGEVRDAVFGAVDDEDADQRTDGWLDDWALFGAVARADGSLRLTPLGRLMADSVTAMLTPAVSEAAAAVVARFSSVPVRVAIRYLTPWLAARGVVAAAGELIDFAGSATPYERATAIDLAAELGPDATPAWSKRAELPGYGAYVREWLADQGEQVPEVPGDETWMAAEMLALMLEEAPPWMGDDKVVWAVEEVFDTADALAVLEESRHPDAARLIDLVQNANG